MKKLSVLALALTFAAVTAFAGTTSAKPIKVAMVTDVGGVNDQSFNQSAWEGLQRAGKELGTKIAYKESRQDGDYAPNLETFTDAGNDLIWGIGFLMADAIMSTAKLNPDQYYGIVDISYGEETPENVTCAVFQEEQPSFLVGYIAGKMTKTNKIGFVGGIKFPLSKNLNTVIWPGQDWPTRISKFCVNMQSLLPMQPKVKPSQQTCTAKGQILFSMPPAQLVTA